MVAFTSSETPKLRKAGKGTSRNKNKGVCDICGDWATGIHYKAVTCEGCKGFFRRSQQQNLTYKCIADGNCEINKHNRTACCGCRYRKCLSVMSPELVMPPAERDAKRELIEHNRQRRELTKSLADPAALGISPMTEETEEFIDKLDQSFGRIFMKPLSFDQDRLSEMSMAEQNAAMLRDLQEKCQEFIQLAGWGEDKENIFNLHYIYRVEIQLMEIMSNIDLSKGTLCLKNGQILDLQSLGLPQQLHSDFMALTHFFQSLWLTNEAMSLISAILLCTPSPISAQRVMALAGNEGIKSAYEVIERLKRKYSEALISYLHYKNEMVEEGAEVMYPKVATFIFQLLAFASQNNSLLLENNTKLIRMFM